MYRNTRFGEILKGLSRGGFERMVTQRKADKHTKGFSSWNHLVAMIYAQIGEHRSLREVETGFNSQASRHYHLGCQKIKRSTLSDANRHRDAGLFVDTCQQLMGQVNRKLRGELKTFLYLLDSTSITLKGLGYDDWTQAGSTRNTQGIKLHLLMSAHDALPQYCNMTNANVNDISDASNIEIEENAIYAFDKGYCDYNWWNEIDRKGATFVTRYKNNAALIMTKEHEIPAADKDTVLKDEAVKFKYKHPGGKRINRYEKILRRIVIARPDYETPLVLATNDMESSALEIAEIYKKRWLIELFFKWIKQNLKIKKFLGRSENAVRIQLYSALISYLLIALYRHTQGLKKSMKDALVLIKATLFQRPETEWYLIKKRRRIAQQQVWQQQICLI
jgi:putative transposase